MQKRWRLVLHLGVSLVLVLTAGSELPGKAKPFQKLKKRNLTAAQLETMYDQYRAETEAEQEELAKVISRRILRKYEQHLEQGDEWARDVLVLSGGGAKGAFGAGFLQGWGSLPDGPAARPRFDVVTGVSTGALLAPFAFIGTNESYQAAVEFYANPDPKWAKKRMLGILPNHLSVVDNSRLQQFVVEQVNTALVDQIAAAASDDRVLLIGATNLDLGIGRVFDLGKAALAARGQQAAHRVHAILLASSAIPGVFPPIEIDDFYYADGGATSNILWTSVRNPQHDALADLKAKYPDAALPEIRVWIIVNEKLRPRRSETLPKWISVSERALATLTSSSQLISLRAGREFVEQLREVGFETQFRFVAIPADAPDKSSKTMFDRDYMEQLETLGRKMGADPASWESEVPDPDWYREN